MNHTCTLSLVLALFLVLPVFPAAAQDEADESSLFLIHEDQVYPDKVMAYEQTATALKAAFAQHSIPYPYSAATTNDLLYVYIFPVDGYGGLDDFGKAFEMLAEKMGEEAFATLMGGFEGTYPMHRDYLLRMRPDLSYNPAHGMEAGTDLNFRHWSTLYIKPGMEQEAEAMAKAWRALYEKHGIEQGFRIFTGDLGSDMPMMLVSEAASDAVDFYTRSAAIQDQIGQEGAELWMKTLALLRQIEEVNGQMRPDLGYQPTEQMGAHMDN